MMNRLFTQKYKSGTLLQSQIKILKIKRAYSR